MAGNMKNRLSNSTFDGNKVPRLTKFLYPFSGIFRDACYALVGSFLLTYAMTTGVLSSVEATYNAQYGVITTAMMIALIWDGINDPIMGFIVEKVHFKLGKFRPWILIGAIGNTVSVILMFLIRCTDASGNPIGDGWVFVGCMIAFYFLWDLFFTMNDVGYWSMLPSLTNDEKERASLTSRVTVAASIGGFLMTAACFLLPTAFKSMGIGAGTVYGIIAIAISILFLVSQVAVFFFCKEKKRDIAQEEVSENTKILDLFKIVWKNKQLLWTVIAMFLYYLACGVLTGGIGLYYFYLNIGYGSWQGGLAATLISVFYVIGNVGAQILYPVIAKRMSKQKILLIFSIVGFAAYALFFLLCVPVFGEHPVAYNALPATVDPSQNKFFIEDMGSGLAWAMGGTMFLYYLIPLIFFFTQGMIYMVILMMFQSAIDYQEWKFGERKEAVAFAWRPLDVKFSSALLRAFQFMIFACAGVGGYFTALSNAEGIFNSANAKGEAGEAAITARDSAIYEAWQHVERWQLVVYGAITVGIILIAMAAVLIILRKKYIIDEKLSAQIAAELEERHSSNAAKAPEAAPVEEVEASEEAPKEEAEPAKEEAVEAPSEEKKEE